MRGFSMVEILVTIFILAVGLLGLAGLQATGLKNNQSAYQRTVALQQAYDMADRIRANPVGKDAGEYDDVSGTPGDPGCITAGCTAAEIAQFDANEWNTDNAALLPSGAGTVTRNGSLFTVTLMWDDDHTGASGTNCSGDTSVDLTCFSLTFEP